MKTSIKQLNEKYNGTFRELTHEEFKFLKEELNKKSDNEWYEPYAVRSKNGIATDILCINDDAYSSSNELFVRIKEHWKIK